MRVGEGGWGRVGRDMCILTCMAWGLSWRNSVDWLG